MNEESWRNRFSKYYFKKYYFLLTDTVYFATQFFYEYVLNLTHFLYYD